MPFEKDENNQFKRIWIEQPVLNLDEIKKIQKEVADINPTFSEYSLDKLHLTLFHVGMPDKLYEEFCDFNPAVNFNEFLIVLDKFLAHSGYLIDKNTEMEVLGFDLLGYRKNPKVVLILENYKYLEDVRQKIILAMVEVFNTFKITDQQKFIEKSSNLRYSVNKNYIPHVTLGELNEKDISFKAPELTIDKVVLYPSRVSNFSVE